MFGSPDGVDGPRCDQNARDDSCETVKVRSRVPRQVTAGLHVWHRVLYNRKHGDPKQPELEEDEGDIFSASIGHPVKNNQRSLGF